VAIADFLLEHYHEIPGHLREALCPQQILEAEPTEQDERQHILSKKEIAR